MNFAKNILSVAVIVIAASLAGACERVNPGPERLELPAEQRIGDEARAQSYRAQAAVALASGEYLDCAQLFAQAAKSSTEEGGQSWFWASRCSARGGDYRQSMFQLRAAASEGFSGLPQLLSEPLFRPLHSGSHWALVVDLVRASEQEEASVLQPDPATDAHPCELISSLRQRFLLQS